MSDPQPVPQRRSPRRAEALQPDKPSQGDEREDPTTDAAGNGGENCSAEKLRQQSQEALKNVNTGYD